MCTDDRTYVLDEMGYYITYGPYCRLIRIVLLVHNSVINRKFIRILRQLHIIYNSLDRKMRRRSVPQRTGEWTCVIDEPGCATGTGEKSLVHRLRGRDQTREDRAPHSITTSNNNIIILARLDNVLRKFFPLPFLLSSHFC